MARKLASLVYRMLHFGQDCVDIGEQAYETRSRVRRTAGLKTVAKSLGDQTVPQEPARRDTWKQRSIERASNHLPVDHSS